MIRIIDKDFDEFEEFENFCLLDSFGTRIYSHFLNYGYEYNFVDFWVQVNDEKVTAALCRLDGDFIICLSDSSDFQEISSFLSFQNKVSVTFNSKYSDYVLISYDECHSGDILMYKENDISVSSFDLIEPELKQYHDLLLTCESDTFFVPGYFNFLSDVSRRLRKDMCTIYAVVCDDVLASCAMTVSQTKNSVILGAVATNPDYRRRGFAQCVVKNLAEHFKHLKSVYIYTTIEKNTRFYKGIGFEVCGNWTKYTYGGNFE